MHATNISPSSRT